MRKNITIGSVAVALVLVVAWIAVGSAGAGAGTYGDGVCTKTAKAAGCPGLKTADAGCSSKSACASACAAKERQAHYAQVKAIADEVPYRENTRFVVSGTITCGHCELHKTDMCQPFIKTAEGELYPIEETSAVGDMKESGSKQFELTTRVKKEGGIKFLEITSYKAI